MLVDTKRPTATIVAPDGTPATLPHEPISAEELKVLAAYRQFLLKHEYREAIYCNRCWGQNLADGTRMHVKTEGLTTDAMIQCRCRVSYGKTGLT